MKYFYDSFGNFHINNLYENFIDHTTGNDFCKPSLDIVKSCKANKRQLLVTETPNTKKRTGEYKIVNCCNCVDSADNTKVYNSSCNSNLGGSQPKLGNTINNTATDISNRFITDSSGRTLETLYKNFVKDLTN